MNHPTLPTTLHPAPLTGTPHGGDLFAYRTTGLPQARLLLQMLRKMEYGNLRMHLPDGQTAFFGSHAEQHVAAVTITLKTGMSAAQRCAPATSALPKATLMATGTPTICRA